jgi:hypothetical protein
MLFAKPSFRYWRFNVVFLKFSGAPFASDD